jgi:hypothetical protein
MFPLNKNISELPSEQGTQLQVSYIPTMTQLKELEQAKLKNPIDGLSVVIFGGPNLLRLKQTVTWMVQNK